MSESTTPTATRPASTPRQRLDRATQEHQKLVRRAAELDGRAKADGWLSEEESGELMRVNLSLGYLGPFITQVTKEVDAEQEQIDLATVVAAWTPLVDTKRQAYATFAARIDELRAAFDAILTVHGQQEALLTTLPRALRERFAFPDVGTLRLRIASRLPLQAGWEMLLCGLQQALPPMALELVCDVDQGTKPFPPVIVNAFTTKD